MKIKIYMQDPDGVFESIIDAMRKSNDDYTYEDAYTLTNNLISSAKFRQVFTHGESILLEYDTEMGTVEII